jgi:UDP-N-acetyl-2-amino-2-deoxyglucuronate dehydrogenase
LKKKNFCIIGASGFVAPKHMQAIHATNNNLIACSDLHENIGIIDKFFPNSEFFSNPKNFENFVIQNKNKIDYLSVCTPNYLHFEHIKFGIKNNLNIICEKPLVLNPAHLDELEKLNKNKNSISTILQLRIHPNILKLKKYINKQRNKIHDVELTYITPRGKWYHSTWKSDLKKSGGLITNIGIHLFDLLLWLFGNCEESKIFLSKLHCSSGFLKLRNANVKWFLSIDKKHISFEDKNKFSIRNLKINNQIFDLSKGFTDLHVKSYKNILKLKGFDIDDSRNSIELINKIKRQKISDIKLTDYHRLIKKM